MKERIIRGIKFCSEWDGGSSTITTKADVNLDTMEVFNVETASEGLEALDTLEREYIVINDKEYPVYREDEAAPGEYWYK